MNKSKCSFVFVLLSVFLWAGAATAKNVKIEVLGKNLYNDTNLSLYQNQSCKTCHHPKAGYADPANLKDPFNSPVSVGSDSISVGGRNAPSASYAGFSPVFTEIMPDFYIGGMFWDGRATGLTLGDPLAEQAQGPFLNPVEMALPDKASVVFAVSQSNYADLFMSIFGPDAFADVDIAYDNIAMAIAAYERSNALISFNSRFDEFWRACKTQDPAMDLSLVADPADTGFLPQGILTQVELSGLALFNGAGQCGLCHLTSDYVQGVTPPLFTDFTYDNLGIPVNPRIAELAGAPQPIDYGLGGRSDIANPELQLGKFKVPTLRNVAKTAPYGHNGFFPTLTDIANFYNTRDVGVWPPAEVMENMNTTELGDLGLTNQEVMAIVAFMQTLTD